MIAMHYLIRLGSQDEVQAVRRRVAERGPSFDAMPGLAHKWFLVDLRDPAYATFSLWREPKAVLGFLEGPFYRALCEAFSRPDVFLLLPTQIALPADNPTVAVLGHGGPLPAGVPAVRTFDPRPGTRLDLVFDQRARGRCFEVAYHARGTADASATSPSIPVSERLRS